MLTSETAYRIAVAYKEIESGEQLLTDVKAAMEKVAAVDIRDAFGRPVRRIEMGIPSGDNSRRLLHVEYDLAVPVIEAHIAQMRARLKALNEIARAEVGGGEAGE
ncbi:hypothetical protein [Sphingopyxis macrogoltabida]|uniref:Uncharacterized protein n=1 Tax=Sphingopyxis macrogoltabida TaxID=33050 RepID=A0A0N7GTA1_SPHMC|nr:hypothetical protein [Sphingopyxis macrogoltabida]ALH82939.1 hypothetical protein AN936_22050 [Sphingopyxis macrogoltabida]